MPEVDKQIIFNAFHILCVILTLNIFINSNFDYINPINIINYLINIDTPGFWFIILHLFATYLLLTHIQIELGIHAAIKLNL